MTAPPETKATSPPAGDADPEWICLRIVNVQCELICGKPASTEKLVRNDFGIFAVPLCGGCAKKHFNFYAALRAKGQRPRRH